MAVYEYDTLAYHAKERPGTMRRSLAHVKVRDIGPHVKDSINKCGNKVSATREAISFYMLSHAMLEVQQRVDMYEPLGDLLKIVEQYHHALNTLGYRLFNYLMIITTRESRHLQASHAGLAAEHGQDCVDFTSKVKAHSQDALFNYSGDLTLGQYLDYLCDVYFKLSWSSAYGGPKWGHVTKALRDFVYGEINMEMLLDVGYTLAHNGGPIFDKGFHYKHGGPSLLKLLDVQRAGQVPNLVKAKCISEVEAGHVTLLDMIEKRIGREFNPWVNWKLVDKLGALNGPYTHDANQVAQQFGHLPEYQAEMQVIEEQAQAHAAAQAAKKAAEEKGYIEVMPGVKLKKGVMTRG
jgi:hypothetical protein